MTMTTKRTMMMMMQLLLLLMLMTMCLFSIMFLFPYCVMAKTYTHTGERKNLLKNELSGRVIFVELGAGSASHEKFCSLTLQHPSERAMAATVAHQQRKSRLWPGLKEGMCNCSASVVIVADC